VRQTIERRRSRLAGRHLELDLVPAVVRVDGVFLDASLTNVIDNALKYTPADAVIQVQTEELDDAFVRVRIADSGPGVPDAALPHLFEKFYRAPGAPGGSRTGLGIGLAVVKGLIEATGGRVTARRSALGGLEIDLDLPLAHVGPGDPGGALEATGSGEPSGPERR
jgi:signal transduction histidine kinase